MQNVDKNAIDADRLENWQMIELEKIVMSNLHPGQVS